MVPNAVLIVQHSNLALIAISVLMNVLMHTSCTHTRVIGVLFVAVSTESQDVPKLASAPGKGRSGKPSSGKYPFVQPGKVQPVKAIQEDPSSSGGSGSLPPPRTIKRPASGILSRCMKL